MSSALQVAGRPVSMEQALSLLRAYPCATVRYYDGHPQDDPDAVTLTDIGAMAVIDADVTGSDAARLLEIESRALFEAVPVGTDLRDADPEVEGGAYDVALALYETFRDLPGIGPAKTSKLLHRKRPALFPILDRRLRDLYDTAAAEAARASQRWSTKRMFWAAVRTDLLAAEEVLDAVRDQLTGPSDRGIAALTDLRLLDIVAWQLARHEATKNGKDPS